MHFLTDLIHEEPDGVAVPVTVELRPAAGCLGVGGGRVDEHQGEGVAALVGEGFGVLVGVGDLAVVEVFCPDVQRLVDVADVVGQQDHGDRARDAPLVLLGDFSRKDAFAVGDHVDDVPLRAAGGTVGVFLGSGDGYIGVVEFVVGGNVAAPSGNGMVGVPKGAQLRFHLGMLGHLEAVRVVRAARIVPALDAIRDGGGEA